MLWLFFPGHGGRVTSGMSLSAYVVKSMALEMKDDSHPREAILKHAKVYSVAVVCSFFVRKVNQLAFLCACFLALMHRYVRLSVAWSVNLLTSVFLFLITSLLTPVFVWLSAYMAFCICLSAQLFSSLECSGFLSLFVIVWLYSTVRLSVSGRRSNLSVSLPLLLLPARLPDCLVSVCLPAWLLGVWLYVYMYGGKSVGVCVCLTGIIFFFSQAAAEDPYWVSPAYAQ